MSFGISAASESVVRSKSQQNSIKLYINRKQSQPLREIVSHREKHNNCLASRRSR
ncbi:hypothetical protein [Mastigocoleus testarum]|uniref:hypothetical protein n=1 Tax=Mastigocoleus testarum TaxID=996925 RepID=UPI00137A3B98|nr:hypothetical protein [Mastigocoleus testarum]